MTERQPEEEFLSELLDLPEQAEQQRAHPAAQPLLTRREEQTLLRAAYRAGTPTLAPTETERDRNSAPGTFLSDLAAVARKYPVLTVFAAGGIAFLLARRRSYESRNRSVS